MKESERSIAFLGKDTEFQGQLLFEGTMRIDGYFKGEILSKGNLIVGEDGMVEGEMHVSYAVISGEFHGNIVADQRVDLRAPGKIFANILAPTVVIDAGVIFEGNTRMYRAKGVLDTPLGLVHSDEYSGAPPAGITAIYGIVTDPATHRPLKNVKIKCKGPEKRQTQTNSSGYYELFNLKKGEWKVWVEVKGYKKEKVKVAITTEGAYKQDFELTADTGRRHWWSR